MKLFNWIFFVFAASSATSQSVFKQIKISDVSDPEEVSIAINPKNPAEIIGGANLASLYKSNDSGRTWSRQVLKCPAYNVYGDPLVFWDTLENAYYMHLSFPFPKITPDGSWVDRIVLNKSTDHGATFPSCVGFGKSNKKVQDKHWAVVDPKTNYIHTTWTQFDKYESQNPQDSSIIRYSCSKDMGETWSEPIRINFYPGDCLDGDNTVEGAVPCVGPNSELYVAWAGPKGLVFNRSLDTGKTWLDKEIIIDSIYGGWEYEVEGIFRANGLPFMACDLSKGPHRGRIYVCWSDEKHGKKNKDVFISYSDDGGETWCDRILITYHPNHKEQFMPFMTIDQSTGYIYVLYYDRKNNPDDNLTEVCLSVSRNGGKTFNHHTITEKPFPTFKSVFFGDYIGLSAVNGIIRPAWMETDASKKLSVYTSLLTDSLLLGQIPVKPKFFGKEQTIIFSNKVKVPINIDNNDLITAVLYDPMDSSFSRTIIDNKKASSIKKLVEVDFKKLKLPNKTYVLMLYNNNQQDYVWIYKRD